MVLNMPFLSSIELPTFIFLLQKAKVTQYEKELQNLKKEMSDTKEEERKKKEQLKKEMVGILLLKFLSRKSQLKLMTN